MKIIIILLSFLPIIAIGQSDTIRIGQTDYIIQDSNKTVDYDSLFSIDGQYTFDYMHYKTRYIETDLLYKITDNKGNGFDSLYGTRNMRPILHGAAYRGGANNYYHLSDKRNNHNPIPLDGMNGLCKEGFSKGVYLYRENFEGSPIGDTCNCANDSWNKFEYYQKDYFDPNHVRDMLEMVYESATVDTVGPVYLHCWNGWHASGFISAVILKQFCAYSNWDAVNYWDLGTDGANTSPRYQTQRENIKAFEPYPEFEISDSLRDCLCPPMPKNIDSTSLHIEIEHLVVVPEAIPVGFQIVLYNVKFGSGKTSFSKISSNTDIINLKKALNNDPNLKIEIGGFTDNSGSTPKNITISQQRAKFVYEHLISQGFSKERISYKGYGPKKPIYSNRYKSTRVGNRRIEVKILEKTVHSSTKLVDERIEITKASDFKLTYLSEFLAQEKLKPEDREVGLPSNFIIDSLQFQSGSSMIPENSKCLFYLDELLVVLQTNKALKIQINGFTDASGINEKNVILSQERAKAVYDYLVQNGLNPNRVFYTGHGSVSPIAPNAYKWGRDLNRRIEIEFVSD